MAEMINCPRAKSWMTPCIARDGHRALTDPPETCVGCGAQPGDLLNDLATRYPPAARVPDATSSAAECADRLTRLVAEYVQASGPAGPPT